MMAKGEPSWLQEPKFLALAVFGLGLLLAAAAGMMNRASNQRRARISFDAVAEGTAARLESRMQSYAYGLRGVRGVIIGAGYDQITRDRFREYAASRLLDQEFPGARGFGYIRRVAAEEEAAFLARVQRENAEFSIRPSGWRSGDRYVIQYLEPEAPNLAAIGFDIATDPDRRQAADQAALTGEPTLTAPITLMQAQHQPRRSLLLVLPVYATDLSTASADHRSARVVGWTFVPLVIDDVLKGFDFARDAFRLVLRDVTPGEASQALFDSHLARAADDVALKSIIAKRLFGRQWHIEVTAPARFIEQLGLRNPLSTFAIGAVLAALCAGLFYTYRVSALRAYELRFQQARLAVVADNASDAIVGKTLDGVITSWNKAAQRLFGHTADQAIGRTVLELLVPDDRRDEEADILARLSRGEHIARLETVRRRRDGTLVEVAVASSPIIDDHGTIIGVAKTITDITAKKSLERKLLEVNAVLAQQVHERTLLHESTRRDLDNILDAVPFMIAYWDNDLHCRFANRAYAAWYGMVPSELIGKDLRVLLGARFAASQSDFERALLGEELTLDRSAPDKDGGAPKQIEVHLLPDRVDSGVQGFYLLAHNVTEQLSNRERLAKALRETEVLLSVIYQHAIVSMTDRSGKITDVNEAFCRISGYTRDELIGHDHRIINSGYHPRSHWREMWRTIAAGSAWRHIICNRAKDGSNYWVDSIIAPLTGEKGKATKYISIRFDVTAAKRAEFSLRASEALQRGILAHAGSSIIATDLRGVVTLWNRAAEAMLGYRADEVVGVATPTIVHEQTELQSRHKALEADGITLGAPWEVVVARASPGRVDTNEWTYVHKNGSRLPVLLSVSHLLDDAGTAFGYLCIAVDLSERKEQERKLVELNRLLALRSEQAESANTSKSMFLANMSHEIRTPLNAVIGLTHLLEQGALDREQHSLVSNIKLAGRSLLGVVNNVLDLTKIEAGQISVEDMTFDLHALLDQLISVLLVQATAKSITLSLQRDPATPRMLRGDGQHLRQILTNLVSNAIKFTERGGVTLKVDSSALTDKRMQLRFIVSDTGIGIAAEHHDKLFTPFTQGDASTTRRFGGTGLGLSIVRRLVTLMEGNISVTSTEGVGSEFVVTLPFWLEDRIRSGPARPVEVLVAGADAPFCAELVSLASGLGWHAQTVDSLGLAVKHLTQRLEEGTAVEVLVLAAMASDDEVENTVAELHASIPNQKQPAIVLASPDGSEAYAKRLFSSGTRLAILRGGASASSLFNAVQAALVVAAPSSEAPPPIAADQNQALAGRRILVVDDSSVNLEIAAKLLARYGARVRIAHNGQQGFEILSQEPSTFDAVLMDVQMPVLDGLEATRRIRGSLGLKSLPIIALTAGALSNERQRARDAGMNDFISKPFEPYVMLEKLIKNMPRDPAMSTVERASRPPSLPPADWPKLDGVEANIAFTSLNGDIELLRRLLSTLLTEYADLAEGSEERTQPNDETLAARLHKLTGAAGTLGAMQLSAAATAWEAGLKRAEAADHDALRAALAGELQRLRTATLSLLPAAASSPDAASNTALATAPRGPVAANHDLERLVDLVRRQSFRAIELFETLSMSLRHEMSDADFERLRACLHTLQYKEALQVLSHAVVVDRKDSKAS